MLSQRDGGAASPRQSRQPSAQGRIQSFNIRGIDRPQSSLRLGDDVLRSFHTSMHQSLFDRFEDGSRTLFDDLDKMDVRPPMGVTCGCVREPGSLTLLILVGFGVFL
jgi:hypothetical protein